MTGQYGDALFMSGSVCVCVDKIVGDGFLELYVFYSMTDITIRDDVYMVPHINVVENIQTNIYLVFL